MQSRQRICNILNHQPVEGVGLEYHPCQRGLFEHGEKLRALIKAMPGDFEDFSDTPIPVMPAKALDSEGLYHDFSYDEWGTLWESRIFAMTGHPVKFPLEDMERLSAYGFPPNEYGDQRAFEDLKRRCSITRKNAYFKAGWFRLLEKMHALRPFEDVLMDVYEQTPQISELADRLVDYQLRDIRRLIDADADGIVFGDDYGTQQAMLLSGDTWRSFFAPRLERMMEPIKRANKTVFFHSCGYIEPILPDLKRMGVDAIWPQQTAYPKGRLAEIARDLQLAVAVHLDRAHLMTYGTPLEIEHAVDEAVKTFKLLEGGGWFYVEIDHGFPFENIEALLRAIARWRNESPQGD